MRVNFNGQSLEVPDGSSVSIVNGTITAGRDVIGCVVGNGNVVIDGNPGSITAKYDVIVNGDVHGYVDCGGSVQCHAVTKHVDAGGSITCGDVGGSVDASGSVRCGKVGGGVDAGGSVRITN